MTATEPLIDLLPRHEGEQLGVWWFPSTLPGCGVAKVGRKKVTSYTVNEFPTDWAGRAFRLAKLPDEPGTDPDNESYAVFCASDPRLHRCECKGFARWHHCKHIDTVTTLIANGWL